MKNQEKLLAMLEAHEGTFKELFALGLNPDSLETVLVKGLGRVRAEIKFKERHATAK